jgi:hypothetical protein
MPYLKREQATLAISDDDTVRVSPYDYRFSQGANIVPRVLFLVEPQPTSPLGVGAGRRLVRSARSSYEKTPWKDLPGMKGVVEAEFVRPLLLSENVLPYRVLPYREAVLPLEGNVLLDADHPHLDLYPGLAEWWRQAERLWDEHRTSERLTLVEQINFRNKLTEQLPISPLRLIYTASGMHVSAALVEMQNLLVEHGLYWGTVTSHAEGFYLCAILNNHELTQLVRPLMSYGKDERHIDKHVWHLPIPLYDAANPVHQRLSSLGRQEAELVAGLDIDEHGNFVTLRQDIRELLATASSAEEINQIVMELLE